VTNGIAPDPSNARVGWEYPEEPPEGELPAVIDEKSLELYE
jgi:hypothetical protein